jgi:WhiB family transcriptional regulator, redox-sensing transcriptional regulator
MFWQEQARCHRFDPEIFFDPRVRFERKAKAICSGCDVREECLAFALESKTEFGVWGGLTGQERRTLVRRGRSAAFSAREPATASA